ncbi:non-hydrolyzing UDP-N-acetylglucosamine 2-epimerase [Halococcus sediminicola]|uniref:non-hydrolyzing UDP-N-acetylglucosamine 2-epimerase n=1 Tax=Halococcus sediminicola TaxID=1264579 RepID=UPI0006784C4A|nr:UDP-N-acetylglucosamine 2-epimerase (non-hydrolyzing) [Halococcus sediminicola]
MTDGTTVTIVLGTRPEIIKLAPVIDACEERGIAYSVVHTGQHYSEELDTVFFDQLELPTPDHNLGVGSGSQSEQTGAMIPAIEAVLLDEQPELVLVQGDTNSVLAGAIAASKLECEVGHVEAGLRSFDRSMPEEVNRVLADHAADYLFAPTEQAANYLHEEGIPDERVHITGNTIVDSVMGYRDLAAEKSAVLDELGLDAGEFCLLTAHRAENVDDRERFESLLDGVARFARESDLDVVYPVHPRAAERLAAFDIGMPAEITPIDSQDFLDFLRLESTATLVLTDSGGVQEETCILGTPCVTLRDNTERPETVDVGANRVIGIGPESIVAGAREALDSPNDWENPFGDGRSAERILDIANLGPTTSVEEVCG